MNCTVPERHLPGQITQATCLCHLSATSVSGVAILQRRLSFLRRVQQATARNDENDDDDAARRYDSTFLDEDQEQGTRDAVWAAHPRASDARLWHLSGTLIRPAFVQLGASSSLLSSLHKYLNMLKAFRKRSLERRKSAVVPIRVRSYLIVRASTSCFPLLEAAKARLRPYFVPYPTLYEGMHPDLPITLCSASSGPIRPSRWTQRLAPFIVAWGFRSRQFRP